MTSYFKQTFGVQIFAKFTVTLILFLFLQPFRSIAQTLPKVQKNSLYVSSKFKIDGKASEINNTFQAYNTSTNIYYTICNDDKNIYLIVQATDRLAARKIIVAGLTFSLIPVEKGSVVKPLSITYPIFENGKNNFVSIGKLPQLTKDSSRNTAIMDSISRAVNKMHDEAKLMAISGVNQSTDTVSVYNDYGIVAAAKFDNKIAYTYELKIPITYLEKIKNSNSEFTYEIRLNGSTKYEGVVVERIEGGTRTTWVGGRDQPSNYEINFMTHATYVTGTYKVIKQN